MYPIQDQLDEIARKFANVTEEFNGLYQLVNKLESDRWKDGDRTGDVRVWDLYLTTMAIRGKLEQSRQQLKELKDRKEDMTRYPEYPE